MSSVSKNTQSSSAEVKSPHWYSCFRLSLVFTVIYGPKCRCKGLICDASVEHVGSKSSVFLVTDVFVDIFSMTRTCCFCRSCCSPHVAPSVTSALPDLMIKWLVLLFSTNMSIFICRSVAHLELSWNHFICHTCSERTNTYDFVNYCYY